MMSFSSNFSLTMPVSHEYHLFSDNLYLFSLISWALKEIPFLLMALLSALLSQPPPHLETLACLRIRTGSISWWERNWQKSRAWTSRFSSSQVTGKSREYAIKDSWNGRRGFFCLFFCFCGWRPLNEAGGRCSPSSLQGKVTRFIPCGLKIQVMTIKRGSWALPRPHFISSQSQETSPTIHSQKSLLGGQRGWC